MNEKTVIPGFPCFKDIRRLDPELALSEGPDFVEEQGGKIEGKAKDSPKTSD